MKIIKYISKIVVRFIDYAKPRSSDQGIFDPYVPLGSLKQIKEDFSPELPIAETESQPFDEVTTSRGGFGFFKVVTVVIAGLLMFRLIFLQITQGQENFLLAEGNRLNTEPILSPRGLLYDRNGLALVQNIPSSSLIIHPVELLKDSTNIDQSISRISTVTKISKGELKRIIDANSKRDIVVIKEGINRQDALSYELKLANFTGIELTTSPIREYTGTPSLGHVLGYVGKSTAEDLEQRRELLPISYVGKSGVEFQYDKILQGIPGVETLEVDSYGRIVRSIGIQPAKVGRSLLLSIDSELQRQATVSLLDSIKKNNAHSGAAVVLDVRTGDVLAMVSVPFVNNNIFSPNGDQKAREKALTSTGAPLLNRAISGQYPSGSTIKPVTASAALQERVISESTRIDTSAGKIVIGQWTFPDWRVHGMADVKQAIAESNNIFFYTVGGGNGNIAGLGANRLGEYLRKFGFGRVSGIDLPGEATGLVPTPDWKQEIKNESWYIGDTYNLAIGQGDLLVTPLQLTRSTATIANGGKLVTPRVVKKFLATGTDKAEELPILIEKDRIIGSDILRIIREGMRRTVT
ncbi:MAG: penicillin-binding transpeptidase domain-containing protein, partial [Patescibacteria group bacterium]